MANQLQTSQPRQAGESEPSWLLRIMNAIIADIKYIASLFNKTYSGIFINGDGDTVTVDKGLIISVEAPPLPLRLTWDDIGNALYTSVENYNGDFGSDFTTLTVYGNDQLLTGNSTTFAMPSGVFNSNTNLVAINDEVESCTSVGDNAFSDCISLTTATFPLCTTFGSKAFQSCESLTTATFNACTSVGDYAFSGCTALTTATFNACTTVGSSAFQSCTALATATFPLCTIVGNNAFRGSTSLTTATFPLCTIVGNNAFLGCTALTTATFNACTTVGSSAFYSCTALTTVTLPLCADLGGTTGDDSVFFDISGQTITLTIAASRETCDGGNPDGDIVYLAANNTSIINYV